MAEFKPGRKYAEDFNNGNKYINGEGTETGDALDADMPNNIIESQLYTQGLAVNSPEISLIAGNGNPSVDIITAEDGSARLQFKNLKGDTGEKGDKGDSVTKIENTGDREYGDYTISTLRPIVVNTELPEFEVRAKHGKGISSTSITYAASGSNTIIPSTWNTSIPTIPSGFYLWTRTVITYTDGNTSTSYSISHNGMDGIGFNESGNYPNATVGQADQLTTTRKIEGIDFNGTSDVAHFTVCTTLASTQGKSVSITGFNYVDGARIIVRFTNANTANSPMLIIQGSSKPISVDNDTTYIKWNSGATIEFVYYSGTWYIIGGYALAGKPVGTYYIRNNSTLPSSLFGGSWTAVYGRFLVGYGATTSNLAYRGTYSSSTQYYPNDIVYYSSMSPYYFVCKVASKGNTPSTTSTYWAAYEAGYEGGSKDAILVSHKHNLARLGIGSGGLSGTGSWPQMGYEGNFLDLPRAYSNDPSYAYTTTEGQDGTGANMPPYRVSYIWYRTA